MKTFEEWVIIANKIHNNKYTYNIIKKINNDICFEIVCNIHGIFYKKIQNHTIKKQGCPLCSKPYKLTKELFITKSNQIHNNKYDYSLVDYIDTKTKIKIICKEHGIFEQTPSNHYKQNCPKCSKINKYSHKTFIEKVNNVHNNKYCYDNTLFINFDTPVEILCKTHGVFSQMPRNHINGNGCYKCCGKIKNKKDFIEKANLRHNNLYDYSKTNYVNTKTLICIICNIHGDFFQKPNYHLNGSGCQKCNTGRFSKICINWLEDIMKKENIFIQHAGNIGELEVKINNRRYRFDGFCKTNNTVYEFYGDFWHGNPNKYPSNNYNSVTKKTFGELYKYTEDRENIIKNNGYNIVKIWESEYNK